MRYSLLTFGCRVNQAESLAIERGLRARGGEATAATEADVVVVNTCTVTCGADQGARQAIRRIERDNPRARIVVTGCYATREPEAVAALPSVIAVVPNRRKDALVVDLERQGVWNVTSGEPETERHSAERYAGGDGACGDPMSEPGAMGRTAFTLRVQTGCDERCSYCIIPSTRGASRSTPADLLVREVQRAEEVGYREVTLTGVHLGAWGRDRHADGNLGSLLGLLIRSTRHLRFRLGSLEPMDVPPQLVDLAAEGRLAPAFHLPLQHASDRMLRAMRRPYTLADYRAIVDCIRTALPYATIGSDVIVGFPGESAEDADTLFRYLAASPLTQLHVFPYSDRPGTEASALPAKVDGRAIRERAQRVRAIGTQLTGAFRASLAGTVRPALTIEDGSIAVTDNGIRVSIPSGRVRNERVLVRLGDDCANAKVI